MKHKIDNVVGLESSDLRLTVGDVGSSDSRSSSGGWPGGLDNLNGKHSFYQLKKKMQQVHKENSITTTPSLSNPLSFKNETEGSFGIASLATSTGSPFDDVVLQTCS